MRNIHQRQGPAARITVDASLSVDQPQMTRIDAEAGLLSELARGGLDELLVLLDMTAGERPAALEWRVLALDEQDRRIARAQGVSQDDDIGSDLEHHDDVPPKCRAPWCGPRRLGFDLLVRRAVVLRHHPVVAGSGRSAPAQLGDALKHAREPLLVALPAGVSALVGVRDTPLELPGQDLEGVQIALGDEGIDPGVPDLLDAAWIGPVVIEGHGLSLRRRGGHPHRASRMRYEDRVGKGGLGAARGVLPPAADAGWAAAYFPVAEAYARAEIVRSGSAPDADVLTQARALGIELHPFKRIANPRVRTSLNLIRALAPRTLLDAGTGRGLVLWPLMEEQPGIELTALDQHAPSVARLQRAFEASGFFWWRAVCADVTALPFVDRRYDVVSAFELLEHVPDPHAAVRELWRVAERALVMSFPRRPDDCPDHLRHFELPAVSSLLDAIGRPRCSLLADRERYFVIVTRGS